MNPITPDVEIDLRGTKYKLSYRHRDFAVGEYRLKQQGYDFCMIGPQAGMFWGDLIEADQDGPEGGPVILKKFNSLHAEALLYVGLLRKAPLMTFDQVLDLVDFDNLSVLGEVVAAAATVIIRISPAKNDAKEATAEPEAPLAAASSGAAAEPSLASTSESATESSGT
jgi:hypothetical protein